MSTVVSTVVWCHTTVLQAIPYTYKQTRPTENSSQVGLSSRAHAARATCACSASLKSDPPCTSTYDLGSFRATASRVEACTACKCALPAGQSWHLWASQHSLRCHQARSGGSAGRWGPLWRAIQTHPSHTYQHISPLSTVVLSCISMSGHVPSSRCVLVSGAVPRLC